MKKTLSAILCLTVIGFTGCVKKSATPLNNTVESNTSISKKYDTLKPLTFLPAFPGSWWKYLNQTDDTVKVSTGPNYIKHAYSYGVYGQTYRSDTVCVPVYDGYALYGYKTLTGLNYTGTALLSSPLVPLLSETSTFWCTGAANSHLYYFAQVVKTNDTVTLFNKAYSPVVVVQYYERYDSPTRYFFYKTCYYAKNVGLIKEENINNSDTIVIKRLVDFHIH